MVAISWGGGGGGTSPSGASKRWCIEVTMLQAVLRG